jgi:hypothetical protein
MTIKLTGQAQERMGKSELVIITERVDDVALLLAQMIQVGFVEILDRIEGLTYLLTLGVRDWPLAHASLISATRDYPAAWIRVIVICAARNSQDW